MNLVTLAAVKGKPYPLSLGKSTVPVYFLKGFMMGWN